MSSVLRSCDSAARGQELHWTVHAEHSVGPVWGAGD